MSKNNNKLSYRDKYLKILSKFPNIEKNNFEWEKSNRNNSQLKDLIDIWIEIWKIEKKVNKIKKTNQDIIAWLEFPIWKIYWILEKNKIKLIDYTWKKYIEWMNWIDIVSVEKNDTQNEPIILDSISPMVEVDWVIFEKSKVIVLSK